MCKIQRIVLTFLFVGLTFACENSPNISPTVSSVVPENGGVAGGSVSFGNAIQVQNCGNPNDWEPDDTTLQGCLDKGGIIELEPGNPGYIVNGLNGDVAKGLYLTSSGITLGSSGGVNRARIIAGRELFAMILQTQGDVNNFSIKNISFDGMVDEIVADGPYRRRRDDCIDGRAPGNIFLQGRSFQFKDNESINAMCGTGLGLSGSDYDIQNNYIAHNGRDKNSGAPGAPWSDGITVLRCESGYIAHNVFVDNTDIDLVLGGGFGCVAELNTIGHFGKYAFSGLNIGNFNNGGNHTGSEYRGNTIYSKVPDRLGIGISVGSHMWTGSVQVYNAGRVVSNTVYGAGINMYVDGVYGGEITGNNVHDPVGNDIVIGGCQSPINYGVFIPHVTNTILQGGWSKFPGSKEACDGAGMAGL